MTAISHLTQDIEFQDKSLQLIFEETITLLTKIKRVKKMALNNISQQDKIKVVW